MVAGAIRTDFILSAEIMVIALKEVIEEPLVFRGVILAVVALGITAVVYGVGLTPFDWSTCVRVLQPMVCG